MEHQCNSGTQNVRQSCWFCPRFSRIPILASNRNETQTDPEWYYQQWGKQLHCVAGPAWLGLGLQLKLSKLNLDLRWTRASPGTWPQSEFRQSPMELSSLFKGKQQQRKEFLGLAHLHRNLPTYRLPQHHPLSAGFNISDFIILHFRPLLSPAASCYVTLLMEKCGE